MARPRFAVAVLLIAVLALGAAAFAPATTPVGAPEASAQGTAPTSTARKSCRTHLRRARRHDRGTRARRVHVRRYERCRRRARTAPAPSAPAPAPPSAVGEGVSGPGVAAPQPQPGPFVFPNPNGYVVGQGCYPAAEASYNAAGFTCQVAFTQTVAMAPGVYVPNQVWLLFLLPGVTLGR